MNIRKFTDVLRNLGVVWILLLVGLLLTLASPDFLSVANLLNVVLTVSVTALLAAGQTFVILLGEIDLSVGAALGFTSLITALSLQTMPLLPAMLCGLAAGLVAGLVNGLLVTKANMPSFIATLATMSILAGLTLYIGQGNPVKVSNQAFLALGQGRYFGAPAPVWIMLVLCLVFGILLARTRYGRQIYATGDNKQAAKLSGIPVDWVVITAYMISGALAACGGFILTARLSSAQPTAGTGLELTAIAAVIIGGTRMTGGKGVLAGTVVGALLLGVIDDGLNLLNVSSFLQGVVKGLVILIAVFIDRNANSVRARLTRAFTHHPRSQSSDTSTAANR
jgi:ribose transport system permease protein